MADPKLTIWTWMGLRGAPDLSKARWLGPIVGVVSSLVIVVTVVLVLYEFIIALAGTGFDDPVDQSTAIRNIGLVVAALVSVPFVVWRTSVAQAQSKTATDSLFNDKINAASADLHAMRQRSVLTEDGRFGDAIWETDVTKRNAALDRLKELVEERPEEATRVARLLSAYIRELSVETSTEEEADHISDDWKHQRMRNKSNVETAMRTLGSLNSIDGAKIKKRAMWLAKARLENLDLRGQNYDGADFRDVDLSRANLVGASLRNSVFLDTNICGTLFWSTKLHGALFMLAKLDENTSFRDAKLFGAGLVRNNFPDECLDQSQISSVFGDASVRVAGSMNTEHWSKERSDSASDFDEAWRAWQKSIGFDPEDPSTWNDPDDI